MVEEETFDISALMYVEDFEHMLSCIKLIKSISNLHVFFQYLSKGRAEAFLFLHIALGGSTCGPGNVELAIPECKHIGKEPSGIQRKHKFHYCISSEITKGICHQEEYASFWENL